jgi:hypothetical protein
MAGQKLIEFPDEGNLLFMTPEERKAATNDFLKYRQMLARRRYRDLKNLKLMYVYPIGASATDVMRKMASLSRRNTVTVTQSINDLQ